ncbi:MEGF10_11 [Mytilus edulis]|uniref:MEGF10_11 n=1 Tax=Mytilus edulis TaxID=6550 RepID=A0A8S3S719_MYTED|nr:MEGF10_11 [Mytilus edulis]
MEVYYSILPKVNLALHGTAAQETTYSDAYGTSYNASLAVEGPANNNWADGCSSTAAGQPTQWWRMSFSKLVYITNITYYLRSDTAERMNGFRLYFANGSMYLQTELCFVDKGYQAFQNLIHSVDCDLSPTKNVYFFNRNTYVELCYIEINEDSVQNIEPEIITKTNTKQKMSSLAPAKDPCHTDEFSDSNFMYLAEPIHESNRDLTLPKLSSKTKKRQFVTIPEDSIDTFVLDQENKNTSRKTQSDIQSLQQFLVTKLETREIYSIPPHELNQILCQFLISVRKDDGNQYEPASLKGTKSLRDQRDIPQMAWANPENELKCPVHAYKLYKSKRPLKYSNPTDPFYIQENTNREKSGLWYKSQPIGINKLGKFMKKMATAADTNLPVGIHKVYCSNTTDAWTDGILLYNAEYHNNDTTVFAICKYIIYIHPIVNGNSNIDICEIEIGGCPYGKYGDSCQLTCPKNCKGTCDLITGNCSFGCSVGWLACDMGKFGNQCLRDCSVNCLSSCNHMTGKCTTGCKKGWEGFNCTEECSNGNYGWNCTETCDGCIVNECNHINGVCKIDSFCKPGYVYGKYCNAKCEAWHLELIALRCVTVLKYHATYLLVSVQMMAAKRDGKVIHVIKNVYLAILVLIAPTYVSLASTSLVIFFEGNCRVGCNDGYRGRKCDMPEIRQDIDNSHSKSDNQHYDDVMKMEGVSTYQDLAKQTVTESNDYDQINNAYGNQ